MKTRNINASHLEKYIESALLFWPFQYTVFWLTGHLASASQVCKAIDGQRGRKATKSHFWSLGRLKECDKTWYHTSMTVEERQKPEPKGPTITTSTFSILLFCITFSQTDSASSVFPENQLIQVTNICPEFLQVISTTGYQQKAGSHRHFR